MLRVKQISGPLYRYSLFICRYSNDLIWITKWVEFSKVLLKHYCPVFVSSSSRYMYTEYRWFEQDGTIPLYSETHGGDDVAMYAIGPMAHLFHGVQEQNYLAHAMRYAGCYDDEENICNTPSSQTFLGMSGAATAVTSGRVAVALAVILSALIKYF